MITAAVMCMALNIYHEARGEPLVGQIAVVNVVNNRVASPLYPDNICDVVKEAEYWGEHPIRHKCQFSWWCDGKSDEPTDRVAWERSLNLARKAVDGQITDITEGSLYYHATHVEPYWAEHFTQTIQINKHIFYR